jgi:serine/threonine-protein kinase
MGRDDSSALIHGRLGRVLKNKWRLERVLAVGGMGAVYEGAHRNGKRVAIKMLHPELCRDPMQRKRFLREGYAANAIGDQRVVTVDDDDVDDDGSAFLVMELLEGESLNRAVDPGDNRLPTGTVLHYMDQLLGVLELAHAKGIVHRDIKPENLFITKNGALKVLDFGIARLREQANPENSDTSQMTIMGTPAYMPPEQAKGRWDRVDGRSDLWSIGATMFRLLSGHYVHDAETRSEQLGLAMTAPARPFASVAKTLDPALIAIVDRALAYDMKDRWQSAGEMRAALQPLLKNPADLPVLLPATDPMEQIVASTMDSISAPVVSPVDNTLSMKGRRRRHFVLPTHGARTQRSLFLAVAMALVVVSAVIWSALQRRTAMGISGQKTNPVVRAGDVGAPGEPLTVRKPSQPVVRVVLPAPSGTAPSPSAQLSQTGGPSKVVITRNDAPRPRRRMAEPMHSQKGVEPSTQSSAMPTPRGVDSKPGHQQTARPDPLDRRR